jgi:hypothetical protein
MGTKLALAVGLGITMSAVFCTAWALLDVLMPAG